MRVCNYGVKSCGIPWHYGRACETIAGTPIRKRLEKFCSEGIISEDERDFGIALVESLESNSCNFSSEAVQIEDFLSGNWSYNLEEKSGFYTKLGVPCDASGSQKLIAVVAAWKKGEFKSLRPHENAVIPLERREDREEVGALAIMEMLRDEPEPVVMAKPEHLKEKIVLSNIDYLINQ